MVAISELKFNTFHHRLFFNGQFAEADERQTSKNRTGKQTRAWRKQGGEITTSKNFIFSRKDSTPDATLAEKKTSQSWIRRPFSTQMSHRESDSNHEVEYTAAVAAAVYAIRSLDESEIPNKKKTAELTKQKTKKINITDQEQPRLSRRFSDIMKNQESEKQKTVAPLDKIFDSSGSKKPESSAPKLNLQDTVKPSTGPIETKREGAARLGVGERDADAWERAEMAKINNRYENLNANILTWEKEKKAKARRHFNRTEGELSRRREESLLKLNREVEYISQIAGGAKSKAAKKKINEELRVKEKSNIIRKTGQVPQTCLCF